METLFWVVVLGGIIWFIVKKFGVARVDSSAKDSPTQMDSPPAHASEEAQKKRAQELYEHGVRLFDSGGGENKRAALMTFIEVTKLDDSHLEAHLRLADASQRLPNVTPDVYVDAARKAFRIDPRHPGARKLLASALFRQGQAYWEAEAWDLAYTTYKESLLLDSTGTDGIAVFGVLMLAADPSRADKLEDFVKVCSELIDRDPDDHIGVHYSLGMTLLEMKRYSDAVARFKAYLERSPGAAEGHFGLCKAYIGLGDLTQARSEYEILKRIDAERANEIGNLLA